MQALWQAKFGFSSTLEGDAKLVERLFELMAVSRADFPYFFRQLSSVSLIQNHKDDALRDLFIDLSGFDAWLSEYRQRLALENSEDAQRKQAMDKVNPKYVLRNYLAQLAIDKAQHKDFSEVKNLLDVLQRPFDEQPEHENYAALPPDWAAGIEVSCSS
ncbi:MAG: protein adenylyltransferase SelO family protein, partial [Burkholderiales bacterium]|nr:protein adenylyltransferase SelO family protein [Burkholderiales bacterium]